MLASPVSPSISLGSRTHTSPSGSSSASLHHHNSSSVSSPNGTYASPRHPAYLPSSSNDNNNNNNATSPSSQRSITSSSPGGDANSTSNYSKYTTISQIERVNDVLVDKVLHAPIPLSHDHQYQQQRYGRNEEQGSALRRLIAFLDGEDHEIGNAVSNAPTAGPSHSHTAAMHHESNASESIYTPQKHSQLQAQPTTPPSTTAHSHQQRAATSQDQANYTPRPSSSCSNTNLHPSYGRASRQAPLGAHYKSPPRVHYDTQQSHAQQEQKSRVAISPARALNAFTKEGQKRNQPVDAPSQSVLLSTQAQLERLKDEVSHLDELVNRLKAQHISTFDQEGVSQTAHYHDEQGHEGHGHNDNNHDEEYATDSRDRKAENMYKQEQAEYDRKRKEILEFESSIASQNDILRLIRHVDSLVWMRNTLSSSSSSPYIPLHSSQSRTQSQLNQTEDEKRKYVGSNNGKGPRNDNIIFTRGNLHHLAKRITAWENIVRRKEEEGRYDYIT